jgi:preprotein translocase subunit SecE
MATKAATVNGEDQPSQKKPALAKRPNAEPNVMDKAITMWNDFRNFLSDVRGETRKVVTPSRTEVRATTTVVIIAVFLFGLFFFVVDAVFQFGLNSLLSKLGGLQ